jgi:ABC-2 type transport system ATP-binding protein
MQYAILTESLTKRFGNFTAVDGITFGVKPGEIFGFLGANGAGKTTAIKMLTGLLRPSAGRAEVGGYDVYRQAEQVKRHIGYMSQRFSLYDDLTVVENIEFYGGIYGMGFRQIRQKQRDLLAELGLEAVKNTLVRALPLGWKQRLSFSIAILHEPGIVFLDEPTSGVDPIARRQFWEMITTVAASGITFLVTTHYMDEAEYCDRVSIMSAGKIAALDSPAALRQQFHAATMDDIFLEIARGEKVHP